VGREVGSLNLGGLSPPDHSPVLAGEWTGRRAGKETARRAITKSVKACIRSSVPLRTMMPLSPCGRRAVPMRQNGGAAPVSVKPLGCSPSITLALAIAWPARRLRCVTVRPPVASCRAPVTRAPHPDRPCQVPNARSIAFGCPAAWTCLHDLIDILRASSREMAPALQGSGGWRAEQQPPFGTAPGRAALCAAGTGPTQGAGSNLALDGSKKLQGGIGVKGGWQCLAISSTSGAVN
jgi:hypothetical protein